jgi:hypothetical protein
VAFTDGAATLGCGIMKDQDSHGIICMIVDIFGGEILGFELTVLYLLGRCSHT